MITIDGGTGKIKHNGHDLASKKMIDQWRRNATLSLNGGENFITTDWERVDGTGQGTLLGTGGMTESGGIFTFPETGIYKVEWQAYFEDSGEAGTKSISIYATTDNSSYSSVSTSVFSVPNTVSGYTYSYASAHTQSLIDVTDTSQVKVKFRVYSAGTVVADVSSSENRNCATFTRIGDT